MDEKKIELAPPGSDIEKAIDLYMLGEEYCDKEDYEKAVELFRRSSDLGCIDALCALGDCYFFGRGVPYDDAETFRCYKIAAEAGFAPAQYMLGCLYECGQGTEKDAAEAAKWYKKAAEQGMEAAETALKALIEQS